MADILRSDPFVVEVAHDGVDTVSYKLYQDGAMVAEQPVSALSNGVVKFDFPNGLPTARSYNFSATALNVDGESAPAEAILVVLPKVPAAPTSISFI